MRRLSIFPATLFIVALSALPAPAPAQVSVGIHAGVDVAKLVGDIDFDYRTGLAGGATLNWQFSELWGIELDAFFVQKGAKDEFPAQPLEGAAFRVERSTRIEYLEFSLPLTLRPRVESRSFQPRVYGGPALALEIGCRVDLEGDARLPDGPDCEESVGIFNGLAYTETKSVDLGILLGLGGDFGGGRGVISIDLRYAQGLTSITDGPTIIDINGIAFSTELDQTNRLFQALIGYRYRL